MCVLVCSHSVLFSVDADCVRYFVCVCVCVLRDCGVGGLCVVFGIDVIVWGVGVLWLLWCGFCDIGRVVWVRG